MLFWQFSHIIIYIRVHGKMPDQQFKVWLFSNPGEKVLILVESRGQICPQLPKQHFNVWLFSNPGEKNLILVEILWSQDLRVKHIWKCSLFLVLNVFCQCDLHQVRSRPKSISSPPRPHSLTWTDREICQEIFSCSWNHNKSVTVRELTSIRRDPSVR